MKELSLFSGAGGGLLGSKLLGWRTVGYVEFNDYCQRVIKQRITDGILDNAPIFGDIRAFNSEGYAASYKGMVDVITGGFPCQPHSVCGKQLGGADERNMWPETRECIRIVQPRFAWLENVTGIISSGYIGEVLSDLSKIGYNARWCVLSASDCGAEHKRQRVWILAYSCQVRWRPSREGKVDRKFTCKTNFPGKVSTYREDNLRILRERYSNEVLSRDFRGADDVAVRMDRLRAIGNGQVPAVVRAAWEILSEGLI